MQIYVVYLDTDTTKMNAEVIELVATSGDLLDQEIHRILNATWLRCLGL